jgi:hypothetical protein
MKSDDRDLLPIGEDHFRVRGIRAASPGDTTPRNGEGDPMQYRSMDDTGYESEGAPTDTATGAPELDIEAIENRLADANDEFTFAELDSLANTGGR